MTQAGDWNRLPNRQPSSSSKHANIKSLGIQALSERISDDIFRVSMRLAGAQSLALERVTSIGPHVSVIIRPLESNAVRVLNANCS